MRLKKLDEDLRQDFLKEEFKLWKLQNHNALFFTLDISGVYSFCFL